MDHLSVEEFLCVRTECQFKTSVMNSERDGCLCVCVSTHNWAPEIGIVYLHFESQISRLIFVHYTRVCARRRKFFPFCSSENTIFFQKHVPLLYGKSLPDAEYITMWMYVNFYLLLCSSKLLSLPLWYWKGICSKPGNTLHAGLASETAAGRPKCFE